MIQFERVSATDSSHYLAHLKQCPQVPSDCGNAIIFGYDAVWTPLERGYAERLCWQRGHYRGNEFWLPPMGDWSAVDWKSVFSREIPAGTRFRYVPQMLRDIWTEALDGAFDTRTDPNEWDYIYDVAAFWDANPDMRNKFRRFCRRYDYALEPVTASNLETVLRLDRRASKAIHAKKPGELTELDEDDAAMLRILDHWDSLGTLGGLLLRVGDEYISYSIWDAMDDRVFELYNKNIYAYRDAHDAMLVERTAALNAEGRRMLNDMCDAGDPGLKLNKGRHNPCGMLKKYSMLWHG